MKHYEPDTNQLVWRTISKGDETALLQLDAACKAVDGEEPVSNLAGNVLQASAANSDNTLGVAVGSALGAAAWVSTAARKAGVQTIRLGGQVRPEFRRRGIGEALLAWSESRALQLAQPDVLVQLMIVNEALTEDANKLYLDYGYENTFSELMLIRSLEGHLPDSQLSDGLTERPWDTATAPLFFKAYAAGFRDRLGDVEPVEAEWIASYAEGGENFRPEVSRVVLDGPQPVGFVTCEIAGEIGWISQIAVGQEHRRRGLAHALLAGALKRLKRAGCHEAALHVNSNNPRAQSVFFDCGFSHRLVRAKFVKEIAMGA